MSADDLLQFLSDHYEDMATMGLDVGRIVVDMSAPLILAILDFLAS